MLMAIQKDSLFFFFRTVCCNETLSKFVILVANTANTEQGLYIGWIDVKVRISSRKLEIFIYDVLCVDISTKMCE